MPIKLPLAVKLPASPPSATPVSRPAPEPPPAVPDTAPGPAAGVLLMTQRQTAAALGIGVGLLKKMRAQGRGPRALLISERVIRYRPEDIAAFLDSCAGH